MTRPVPAAAGLSPAGAPHSPQLLAGIAGYLARFAEDAEAFGIVLCSDYDVATRYLVQLQQIDRLAQSLREMANVLTADDPDAAVAAIRLGELRQALEQVDAR
jgi:hypothetical protein